MRFFRWLRGVAGIATLSGTVVAGGMALAIGLGLLGVVPAVPASKVLFAVGVLGLSGALGGGVFAGALSLLERGRRAETVRWRSWVGAGFVAGIAGPMLAMILLAPQPFDLLAWPWVSWAVVQLLPAGLIGAALSVTVGKVARAALDAPDEPDVLGSGMPAIGR